MLELSDKEWLGLAEDLSKILQFYHKEGYISFNVITVSGATNEHLDYFDVNLKMVSKPGIQALSFTDAGHSHNYYGMEKPCKSLNY